MSTREIIQLKVELLNNITLICTECRHSSIPFYFNTSLLINEKSRKNFFQGTHQKPHYHVATDAEGGWLIEKWVTIDHFLLDLFGKTTGVISVFTHASFSGGRKAKTTKSSTCAVLCRKAFCVMFFSELFPFLLISFGSFH